MLNPSNLYAEKVFSEHPVGLWALDDLTDISKSTNTGVENYIGIPAQAYGLQNIPGYYITNEVSSFCKNSGVPLVYGASNATTVIPNNGSPSLIIPGFGFMNEVGKYKDLTFEAWIRINSDHPKLNRIFGNLYGTDGLYVDGPFLTLKIGNTVKSHFVGEWSRPMLINITISKNETALFVNGERVITLNYITSDLSFPEKYNGIKDQDWLAFYSYDDIYPFEIDCIGIYPYKVAEVVAKRRFVYGQGVDSPENFNTSYDSSSAVIDYTFSNYGNNYNYPDIGNWSQGVYDNLNVSKDSLSIPAYSLPNAYFLNKQHEDWITDLSEIQNDSSNYFINLKPNNNWESENGSLVFNKFNELNTDTAAIYGVFKVNSGSQLSSVDSDTEDGFEQVLFRVENSFTGDYISANLAMEKIKDNQGNVISRKRVIVYKFKYGTNPETIIYTDNRSLPDYIPDQYFVAGFHVRTIRQQFENVASFFGKRMQLKIYLGGVNPQNNDGTTRTFAGNIYSLNLCTDRNYNEIIDIFGESGFIKTYLDDVFHQYFNADGSTIDSTINSYSYNPVSQSGYYTKPFDTPAQALDGGKPPTYFPTVYDSVIDIINEHEPSYMLKLENNFGFFYLDVSVKSYWQDYVPLSYFSKYIKTVNGSDKYDVDYIQFNVSYPEPTKTHAGTHDSSDSYVRTYISFQYLAAGISNTESFFTDVKPIPTSMVVVPGTDWYGSKYEVVTNSVIYMPKNVDLSQLAIVIHMDFDVNTTSVKPVTIKKLQLASQSLNESIPTKIGTKFGVLLSPYIRQGVYYDFKSNNPLALYKGSTPHLYLTQYSGIQLLGTQSSNRGISIEVNPQKNSDYQIGAFQMGLRYPTTSFPTNPVQILDIEASNYHLKLFLKAYSPTDTSRGIIYAEDGNGAILENENSETGIYLFLNGVQSEVVLNKPSSLVVEAKQWNILGLEFKTKMNFNYISGSIKLSGPMLMNFISKYRIVKPTTNQTQGLRSWNQVKTSTWQNALASSWIDQLFTIVETSQNIDPANLYTSFIGTNKIIVEDDTKLKFQDYQYQLHDNIVWQSQILSAV